MTIARRTSTYFGAALLGGLVGALVGLLVAPGPGDETRRRIARHSIEEQEQLLRRAEMGVARRILELEQVPRVGLFAH